MKRHYTDIGNTEGIDRAVIDMEINALVWETFEKGKKVAFSPGWVIKDAIVNLKIPNPSHYAISKRGIDGRGLIGIRGHYSNGMADIYILDVGVHATVMATDFYPVLDEDISHLIPLTSDPDHEQRQTEKINKLIKRGLIDVLEVNKMNGKREEYAGQQMNEYVIKKRY